MSSTPFTSCSIGVATVSAITCGDAPGYEARTTIVGGTMSGYAATGSETYAIPPMMTITIESTAAKMGRSMKKRLGLIVRSSRSALAALGRCRRCRRGGGCREPRIERLLRGGDLDAGDEALRSAHHD